MAGSAILGFQDPAERLQLLTLTVNNACNLKCPHCYLQYRSDDSFVATDVVDRVLESGCTHVAIVGKEPLVTRDVARQSWGVIERAAARGKRVSVITNGLGLDYLPAEALRVLDFVDVSFDGGPATYQSYRGPSYQKLIDKISGHVARGFRRFRALSVLSTANVDSVDDVLRVGEIDGVELLMLSLYLPTRNDGENTVASPPLEHVLSRLAASGRFRGLPNTLLLISKAELEHCGWGADRIDAAIERLRLRDKVVLLDRDPIELGVMRVTYDGYALTPMQSLHPAEYRGSGVQVRAAPLDVIYACLRGAGAGTASNHVN